MKEAGIFPRGPTGTLCRSQWKTLSHKVGNLVYVYKGPSECRLRRTGERQGGRETS